MTEAVSLKEIDQCIEEISRHPKGAQDTKTPPEEVHCHAFPGGRCIYINFVNRDDVPVGSIYRTWIVQFSEDKPERVSYFRSRRGDAIDDTLPGDD